MAQRPVDEQPPAEQPPAEKPPADGEPVQQSDLSAGLVLRLNLTPLGDGCLAEQGPVADSGSAAEDGLVVENRPVVENCHASGDGVSTVDIVSLVTEHHAVVYRYAYRLTGSVHEAEDLSQQTFLTAQQKLDQLRSSDRALGWLFAILRTCYLKSIRKRRPFTEGALELDLAEVADESASQDLTDVGFELEGTSIDGERLQAALNELPDEFRLVLVMFYFEELSYREIAARLEMPAGTVMSRLSRAKGHLRMRLTGQEFHAAKSR